MKEKKYRLLDTKALRAKRQKSRNEIIYNQCSHVYINKRDYNRNKTKKTHKNIWYDWWFQLYLSLLLLRVLW